MGMLVFRSLEALSLSSLQGRVGHRKDFKSEKIAFTIEEKNLFEKNLKSIIQPLSSRYATKMREQNVCGLHIEVRISCQRRLEGSKFLLGSSSMPERTLLNSVCVFNGRASLGVMQFL